MRNQNEMIILSGLTCPKKIPANQLVLQIHLRAGQDQPENFEFYPVLFRLFQSLQPLFNLFTELRIHH